MYLRGVLPGCLLAAVLFAQDFDAARIDTAAERSMRAWGVPGAAVAVIRGERVYVRGYGVRTAGHATPVTPATVFAIGSTTKAFTTAAMAILADEGRLSWDDPVRKHIPEFRLQDPLADHSVTLRDLVTHRTGLSRNDMLWYDSPWDREELIRRIAFLRPTRAFRAQWQYNNLMFLAAGYAAGKCAGATWEDYVRRRIFEPLGMASANFRVEDAQKLADHATPHVLKGGTAAAVPWRALDNIGPAGSINASVNDLLAWVRLHLNQGVLPNGTRLISERNMDEMHSPQMAMRRDDWGRSWNPETNQMTYGLGWTLHDYRGRHLVSHGGAIDGFRANITLLPREKTGIVVLANLGQENMPEALRFTLIDIALGLSSRDWDTELKAHFREEAARAAGAAKGLLESRRKNTKPSLALADYAGEYTDPAYGSLQVLEQDGGLSIAWSRSKARLEHFQFDTFQAPSSLVQFRLSPEASVRSVTYLGVEFLRKD